MQGGTPQRSPIASGARSRRTAAAVKAATLAASPVRLTGVATAAAVSAVVLPPFNLFSSPSHGSASASAAATVAAAHTATTTLGAALLEPATSQAAAGAEVDPFLWNRCADAALKLATLWKSMKNEASSSHNSNSNDSNNSCCCTQLYSEIAQFSWELQRHIASLLPLLPAKNRSPQDPETAAAVAAAAAAAAAAVDTPEDGASSACVSAAKRYCAQAPTPPAASIVLRLVRTLGTCSCEAAEGSAALLSHMPTAAAAGGDLISTPKPGCSLHELVEAAAAAAAETYGALLSIESLLRSLALAFALQQRRLVALRCYPGGADPFAALQEQRMQQHTEQEQEQQLQRAVETLRYFEGRDFEGLASAVVSRCMAGFAALQQQQMQQQQMQR
ncbi:uncharacterized protein LOC113146917, partial [Cyclospora cayetanensis]|uniref:Uncharacterized protein LOC113146917 n=1 Tax=Cyclospora cayetanensis TaxID=88456 RepID=A0A6P6RVG7_9EIME